MAISDFNIYDKVYVHIETLCDFQDTFCLWAVIVGAVSLYTILY